MTWITGLLILLGLLVLLRIIVLLRQNSRQAKRTIRLEEAPSDNANPNLPALLFFLLLFLLAATFAIQFLISRM